VVTVHYAGFTVFATATVHPLSAGADSRSPAFLLAVVTACALVAILTVARAARSVHGRRPAAGTATCGRGPAHPDGSVAKRVPP
jgi:hypothetical protein